MVSGQLEVDVPWDAEDVPLVATGLTVIANHEQVLIGIYAKRQATSGRLATRAI